MNEVYLIEREFPYEGSRIESVHETLQRAIEALANIAMCEGPMGFAYSVNYHIYSMYIDEKGSGQNALLSVGDNSFYTRGNDADINHFTNLTCDDIARAINMNIEQRKEQPHKTLNLCGVLYYMERFNLDYDTAYRWYGQADEKWWEENY